MLVLLCIMEVSVLVYTNYTNPESTMVQVRTKHVFSLVNFATYLLVFSFCKDCCY